MKIIHVIHSLDPLKGGTTEALRTLAKACDDAGCHSEVITSDAPDSPWLKDWKIPVHAAGPSWTRYGWTPKLQPVIEKNIKDAQMVVIHGIWEHHCRATRAACLAAGRPPYVIYPHGMLDPWSLKQSLRKRFEKKVVWQLSLRHVLKDAARICFTCQGELDAAYPALRNLVHRSAIVPLGVEAPPDSTDQLKKEFLITNRELQGSRILLFIGRLHPKKGCDLLIKGFARWKKKNSETKVQLRMVGPSCTDAYLQSLQKLALQHSLKINRDITFPGMISGREKWNEIAASEALILPSYQENFGIVVGEALACGKPALLSNCVNTSNWVTEAKAGFVAPPTVEGVESLLDEWSSLAPSALKEYSSRAEQLFTDRFSLKSSASNLISIAEQLNAAIQVELN